MKTPIVSSVLCALVAASAGTRAFADEHDNHQYVHHDDWRKGAKIHDEARLDAANRLEQTMRGWCTPTLDPLLY